MTDFIRGYWTVLGVSLILGIGSFIYAFSLTKKEEIKNGNLILGFVTLGTALVLFGILQPASFSIGVFTAQLNKIEKNLRPYAIISPLDNKLINENFKDGWFKYRGYTPAIKNDGTAEIKFWLKKVPDFLEVRTNGGSVYKVKEPTASDNGFEYLADLEGLTDQQYSLRPYQIVIEAYFKDTGE